jgi:multidrug resistance efflux pump
MTPSKLSPRTLLIAALLIALTAGAIWLYFSKAEAANQALTASGTVEATEVQIAPELSGKVVEIFVEEGDSFSAGDPLLRLDDEMLQSQRKQAVAALQAAQGNLAIAQSGVDLAVATLNQAKTNLEVAKANTQAQLLPAQQALDDLYKNAGVAKAAAEQAVAQATRAAREAQYQLDNFTVPQPQRNLSTMDALAAMKAKLDQARAAFEPYKYASENDPTRKDLKEALDNAQADYDSAVRRLELETALRQALAKQAKALQDLQALQNGPKDEDVAILKAKIAAIEIAPQQAQSAVDQAEVGLKQAQDRLQQALAALSQAQASLDMIDVQIKKLVVRSMTSGVVLSRGVEPGEVVQAGAPVLTIGKLDMLNITVYVPEYRYGEVKLGEAARVSVDSFPGKTFTATVTYISDKAEFTPRNVQTVEGRKTTVYAVRLTIANPDQMLKPGMPADIVFEK